MVHTVSRTLYIALMQSAVVRTDAFEQFKVIGKEKSEKKNFYGNSSIYKYTHGKKLRNTSSPIFKFQKFQLPVYWHYWIFYSTHLKASSTYSLNY